MGQSVKREGWNLAEDRLESRLWRRLRGGNAEQMSDKEQLGYVQEGLAGMGCRGLGGSERGWVPEIGWRMLG